MGVYAKRKEFAPKGSKFFPFRVDPLIEGDEKEDWVTAHESVAIRLSHALLSTKRTA